MGRLDDWLQNNPSKPSVLNPSLASEDFADLWNDTQYANFRNFINKYRGWIDDAVAALGRSDSIEKWRKVFGDEFAKAENVKKSETSAAQSVAYLLNETASHANTLVDWVVDYGISILPSAFKVPKHIKPPPWAPASNVTRNVHVLAEYHSSRNALRGYRVSSGELLPSSGGLWLDVRVNRYEEVPEGYKVRWRITNTGIVAMTKGQGRGNFEAPTLGVRRWEELAFRGVHMAEAFIIRDNDDRLVGFSEPFYVIVK